MSALLSVVVPVRNEAGNVLPLIAEIHGALEGKAEFEVVYVDDGSSDATPRELAQAQARHPRLRVVTHRESCGQSGALLSGVRAATGEWVVLLDGDGQNNPADIGKLLAARDQAGAGLQLVAGNRVQRHDDWLKRVSSRVANAVRAGVLGDATPDSGCGLKLVRRSAYLALPDFDHMHRFLPALIQRNGGATTSVEVSHRPRTRGRSSYGVHDRLWAGMVDLLGVLWLKRRVMRPQISRNGAPVIARALATSLLLLAVLVLAMVVVEEGLVGGLLSKEWIDQEVRDAGLQGETVFVGVAGLATALALPRHIVSFLGGYAFGFVAGSLLALLGTELGCLISFTFSRVFGRPLAGERFGERARRIEGFLAANPFSMSLLIRLLPVGNNFLTCVAAGLSRVPPLPFLLGSLVGYVPQTLVFALAGSGVEISDLERVAIAALLLVATAVLGRWLYRRYSLSRLAS